MTVMHLGCHAGGLLNRPGPMFSEGTMASVSHELEMMMHRFSFWVLIVQGHLVTTSNGYSIKYFNVLLAMLHSQFINYFDICNIFQTQPFDFT